MQNPRDGTTCHIIACAIFYMNICKWENSASLGAVFAAMEICSCFSEIQNNSYNEWNLELLLTPQTKKQ